MKNKKNVSEEVKLLIVDAVKNGETYESVATRFKCNKYTVGRIFRKFNDTGNVKRAKVTGRPPKLTKRQARTLSSLVKLIPRKNSTNVRREASKKFDIEISTSTAQRILR